MTPAMCRLPAELAQDIEQHALDVGRFLKGELSASIMKSRRVPRGVYEQRQNGHYMVRVRIPGGAITSQQVRALAATASCFGNGTLHVTTRQDIQIHDLKIEQTPEVMRELLKEGLTSKGGGGNTVRNLTACPFAGICRSESFDVTPFVVAVTEYLIKLPGSYNLPRKYKIAFSGCGADCALARVNDIGFVAKMKAGKPGFRVYAGGGMGAESRVGDLMEEWVPAEEVIRIAEAGRRLFDKLGDRKNRRRARLRFVVERLGADAFRGMLREAVRDATSDGVPAVDGEVDLNPSPGVPPRNCRHLRVQMAGASVVRQRQPGFVAVPLWLPLGQISWQALSATADVAERFSVEKMLRTSQDQNLLLRFVKEGDVEKLRVEVEHILGADAVRDVPLAAFTACTGAATCRLGLCLAQGAARAAAEAVKKANIRPETLRDVDIHINGCPNACGQHPVGTIGFFGAAQRVNERLVPAYRLLLGARHGALETRLGVQGGLVPARRLPAFVAAVLADFQEGRAEDQSFSDYFDLKGMNHFQSILDRHSSPPGYEDEPSFYRDWDKEEDFSLAGRGPGECGAGVFEVVAEDLSLASKSLEQAEKEASGEHLFAGLLATARALLITRGLDSQDPGTILRSFETHFVDTGLVDNGFRGILARARGYHEGWAEALVGKLEEAHRLLARVEHLYSTMDADLRFHVPEAEVTSGAEAGTRQSSPSPASMQKATMELDLSGVACPMNFVKAKMRLEMMDQGATLGVVLDDGEPVQNVPASFKNEGQEVVELKQLPDGHWRVVIRKTKA